MYPRTMRDSVKNFLRHIKDFRSPKNGGETHNLPSHEEKEVYCGGADLNRIETPSTSKYGELEEVETHSSRPNIATILLVGLLLLVFFALPVIYLLHCFGLIHSEWPHGELGHVVMDHSHPRGYKEMEEPVAMPVAEKHRFPMLPGPPKAQACARIPDAYKFDCHPEDGADEKSCKARGCCWLPHGKSKELEDEEKRQVPLQVPYCFYPRNFGGYRYTNVSAETWGITAYMERAFYSPYPDDVPVLRMDIKMETQQRLHIKIFDPSSHRFEPPYPEVPQVKHAATHTDYNVLIDPARQGFKVIRKRTNATIFDTMSTEGFIFANQFLQLSSMLPSTFLYGLGEHRSTLRLNTHWERFTLFNHDSIPQERTNLYGSHPFYMVMENSSKSHGVFLLNSNAMDVILQPAPAITFRTIGGILDFYFFLGPTPGDVVAQFGYKTLTNTREVMERTKAAGIPMDVQWNDLDYMQRGNDFTYDKSSFAELPMFVEQLHKDGMHYIPLIDAGIASGEPTGSYAPYDKGLELGIFVKNQSGMPFVGKVWNKFATVWPDFTHPGTVDYWVEQLRSLHDQVRFDGAWIDMNEPSNFYDGQKDGCPDNQWERPPYMPGVQGGKLSYKTVCMSAQQYAGRHYDVHNLFGFTHSILTSFAMTEIRERRPFVISRSTFAGQGHYAGHWSGDVVSAWYDMRKTLPQLLSFSMFGVPLMGADICGFNGNTTASLCQRWDQDPVALGPDVAESARKALLMRYTMLPYLYTLFWQAHVQGTTVARPLFFEFPTDQQTYDIDEQFLWGPALLIIPVLDEGKTSVSAYLPHGRWYDLHSLSLLQEDEGAGKWRQLDAPLNTIPLLVRGGYILPLQAANRTTTLSRKSPVELLVAPDPAGKAHGFIYWDDGDSLNTWEEGHYSVANFSAGLGWLQGTPAWWGYQEHLELGRVTVMGVTEKVTSVLVNGKAAQFSYQSDNKLLSIISLKLPLSTTFNVEWK
ncbi:hypothetical protein B566_EDAN012638 [Ephemera danica]|nr:hypothetical protein B566_EDAN012638 [Ephemera danica]